MLLFIDNYDSFSYNLVQYFQILKQEVVVFRHDAISVGKIRQLNPDHIVLSPGPCSPKDAGICVDVIKELGGTFPILGVCLGHQCIGAAFGAEIVRATTLVHGKTRPIEHDGEGLFEGLPKPLTATRYNSLTVDKATLPDCLKITATDTDGDIMGLRHKALPIEGVQFHPESVLSEHGFALFQNFLNQQKATG